VKLTVQVVLETDDDQDSTVVRDVFTLSRGPLTADTVGLRLAEANDLLAAVQQTLVGEQVQAAVTAQTPCPHCGTPRRHKDSRDIVVRTLFGTLRLPSPRWRHCPCRPRPARTFSPLAALLPERSTPELVYLQAKFAGLISYGLSARAARRAAAGRPDAARDHGAPPRLPGRTAPRRRTRPGTPVLHRRLPGRLGGAAPAGPTVDRQPRRRLRALGPAEPCQAR